MYEVVLVTLLVAALIPPFYLLYRLTHLNHRVEMALGAQGRTDESFHSMVSAQRDLLNSFDVFDSLLTCLQYSHTSLSATARSFVSVFRERAASYIERGCEGSLLATYIRQDRLKVLAMELLRQHESDFTRRGYTRLKLDALDNGDFSEYVKLLKYLVQLHLTHIESVQEESEDIPALVYAETA